MTMIVSTIATITLITIIAPGPDYAIVVRNSILYFRRAGVCTALGIGTAVWVHILYAAFGTHWLADHLTSIAPFIRWLGGCYLIFLGIKTFPSDSDQPKEGDKTATTCSISDFHAFSTGFINNILNAKAIFFFMAIFSQLHKYQIPLTGKLAFGIFTSLCCIIWFSWVSYAITHKRIGKHISKYHRPSLVLLSIAFVLFGLFILVAGR